jgi:hypothetical protein
MKRNRSVFLTLRAAVALLPGVILIPTGGAQEPVATFGIEQRVRNEDWNDVFDFNDRADDQRRQIRYRTRVWANLPIGSDIEIDAGMSSETFEKIGMRNVMDEGVFDTLNVRVRKLFVRGLSLQVGRQDLMRGEGLILTEGTPGDGSRSTYFNAADLAYSFGRSKIEAIGILDPRQDRFLPRINDQHKFLQDWDDQAIGLYYTDKNVPDTTIESYYFYKKEIHDRLAASNPQFQPDRRVETVGLRITRKLTTRWTTTGEFASQWGVQHPSTPIRAWAFYNYVKRQSDAKFRPYVQAGFWALSGDDPAHRDRITGWDPLFSRFPKWGDLELYSEVPEKGVGYATNETRWQAETGFTPAKRVTWRFTYYRVGAFHAFGRNPSVFGSGTDRGDNLQTRLDFKLNNRLRGHVDYETLLSGDYYANRAQPYFVRFELIADATVSARGLSRLLAAADPLKGANQ